MWIFKKHFYIFILLIFWTLLSSGQTNISSPYSAFGIGNLSEVTNVRSRSMGGLAIGIRDNFTLNLANPASFGGIDSTSFLFEGGASGFRISLATEEQTESYTSAALTHLFFGFPVTKWWKSSFGLLPFSTMGYDAVDNAFVENVGNTSYSFEGTGGITRVFWANSIQPLKYLTLGVNTSYLFGTMERISRVTFPDSSDMINSLVNSSITVNNLYFEFGAQFHKILDSIRETQFVLGVTYSPQQDISANGDWMVRSYLGELSGVPLIIDTINMIMDEPGTLRIPQTIGIGFSLSRSNRWFFGGEYKYGQWSNYLTFGMSDSLTDSHVFRAGAQITPNPNSFSYIQRIQYRVGGYYNQTYLKLREKQINRIGITFGLGLPVRSNMIRRTRSMINLGFELGRRGTLENGLVQENYLNFHIGLTIYEWWFFKRRYQ